METIIRTTIWICPDGHENKISQDLADSADDIIVNRMRERILYGGCLVINDNKRCRKKCIEKFSERTEY